MNQTRKMFELSQLSFEVLETKMILLVSFSRVYNQILLFLILFTEGHITMEANSRLKDLLSDLSDFDEQGLGELQSTAMGLRRVADKLDKVWRACKIAHASGTSAGIVGEMLTIGGGIAAIMKWRSASPLLVAGLGIGAAGAVINLATSIVETLLNSTEIKKAKKDLKETLDYINNVRDTVQKERDAKDVARLLWMSYLAMERTTVGRASGQAVGDVAESGAKAGSKLTGGLIIGISIAFLIWDALDLGFTIRDIFENEGSEAASFLREIAKELEGLY